MKFVLSPVDSLDPCRHLLCTFLDVSSYHSNGVSEARLQVTLVDRSSAKSISWVTSNGCSGVISCPIFKIKVSAFR